MFRIVCCTVLLGTCLSEAIAADGDWSPKHAAVMTRWAKDVSPADAHSEYPRPQLVRERWVNLNGLWDYSILPRDAAGPTGSDGRILVPFPVESALSGVMRRVGAEQRLWYRRRFDIPNLEDGGRLMLHFGAVDWQCEVRVNGKPVGTHTGGYDPFSFDITDALIAHAPGDVVDPAGGQEVTVTVSDPTDAHWQPRGKQVNNPHGIWYTPVTGIWQTVWLEPVPSSRLLDLQVTPDVGRQSVEVAAHLHLDLSREKFIVEVLDGERVIQRREMPLESPSNGRSGKSRAGMAIPTPRLWSPDSPFLYGLRLTIERDGKPLDVVTSYFAMRSISLGKDDKGVQRLMLNGRPLFQFGPLDQGWWPDGLYTAPTDAALRYDIEITRQLGFNMIRKHVKVEPARWYYWCDKLGMLVWQDMPSGDRNVQWDPFGGHDGEEMQRSAESSANFDIELKSMIDALRNHPSIVVWVPFNEAWGQFDTVRVANWIKQYDPTRVVNCASGGNDFPVGDIFDIHRYPGPAAPRPDGRRAIVLGEYGGLGLPVEGHTWLAKGNWGYRSFDSPETLTAAYLNLLMKLRPLIESPGLAAAVYTQTTDVEIEVNGLLTYDRAVLKVPLDTIAAANRKLYLPPPVVQTITPTAEVQAVSWQFTTQPPGDQWYQSGFDSSVWKTGPSGFGTRDTPGTVVRTEWNNSDIWLRREFEVSSEPSAAGLHLRLHHDEDAEVFLNGVLIQKVTGFTTGYELFPLNAAARRALRVGKNILAIHCHQTGGGQYIDAGLVDVVEQSVP